MVDSLKNKQTLMVGFMSSKATTRNLWVQSPNSENWFQQAAAVFYFIRVRAYTPDCMISSLTLGVSRFLLVPGTKEITSKSSWKYGFRAILLPSLLKAL
jgi:hypothetical protein